MPTADHHAAAAAMPVRCAVVTISDTRTPETDVSGTLMKDRLTEAGFETVHYEIVPDDPDRIRRLLDELPGPIDAILLNGGTGISRRDSTFDALTEKLDKTLPGFGELFRMLSYQEIGPAAMLSRATAGVYRDMLVFSTPGSPNAVGLALDRLIVPELRHMVWEIVRQKS